MLAIKAFVTESRGVIQNNNDVGRKAVMVIACSNGLLSEPDQPSDEDRWVSAWTNSVTADWYENSFDASSWADSEAKTTSVFPQMTFADGGKALWANNYNTPGFRRVLGRKTYDPKLYAKPCPFNRSS